VLMLVTNFKLIQCKIMIQWMREKKWIDISFFKFSLQLNGCCQKSRPRRTDTM
jgi:hypothetical protein